MSSRVLDAWPHGGWGRVHLDLDLRGCGRGRGDAGGVSLSPIGDRDGVESGSCLSVSRLSLGPSKFDYRFRPTRAS